MAKPDASVADCAAWFRYANAFDALVAAVLAELLALVADDPAFVALVDAVDADVEAAVAEF